MKFKVKIDWEREVIADNEDEVFNVLEKELARENEHSEILFWNLIEISKVKEKK